MFRAQHVHLNVDLFYPDLHALQITLYELELVIHLPIQLIEAVEYLLNLTLHVFPLFGPPFPCLLQDAPNYLLSSWESLWAAVEIGFSKVAGPAYIVAQADVALECTKMEGLNTRNLGLYPCFILVALSLWLVAP